MSKTGHWEVWASLNYNKLELLNMNIRGILVVLLAVLFASCDREVAPLTPINTEISLRADVSSLESTRALSGDVYKGTSAAGMEAAIWFSTEIGVYPDNDAPAPPTYLPYRSVTKYDAGNPTTIYINPTTKTEALSYPIGDADNEAYVYCVGMYPSSNWVADADNGAVEHDINGVDDVMFAEQLRGSWQNPFATQHYEHQLTWLKLEMRATDPDVSIHWGKIKNITVVSPQSKVRIEFANDINDSSVVSYVGGARDIVTVNKPTDIGVTVQSAGSILCAPATSYKIIVSTDEVASREVVAVLTDEVGNAITDPLQTVGKLFIINLYFTPFDDIDATCSLVPWNEQNVDIK